MDQNNEPRRIVFEGEEFQHSARSFNSESSKMIQWVIKYSGGLVKDKKQANNVLLVATILIIILTTGIFAFSGTTTTPPPRSVIDESLNKTLENLPARNQ